MYRVIGVFFIIVIILLLSRQYEGFVERTSQTDRVSSITDIISDPIEAEAVADTFYERLNKRNMDIRKKTVRYIRLENVSPQERSILRDAFQYARASYPLPIDGQVRVVVTGDKTEGGYPHTHGPMIYIPIGKIKESTEYTLRNIMIHELSHIHQRQKRHLWERLYSNLGFQRLPIGWSVPQELQDKILANPDTWEGGNWEYKGQHGVILINDDAKSVQDHTYQVIPVRDGVDMRVNQLRKDYGKITQQLDHPAEITATALEQYIGTGSTEILAVTDAIRCWLDECRR